MQGETLVVCPVYNEQLNLRTFYKKLKKNCKWDVLFVNDGSTDESEKIIKILSREVSDCNIKIISHRSRMGYGATLITGFNYAIAHGYENVVTLDSDLQHRPEDISRFVLALEKKDVVLGNRYSKLRFPICVPMSRFIINRYISGLLKRYFNVEFSDPFCGFRGYRTRFLNKIRLREQSYGICLEMLVEIIRVGASYCEIPVALIYLDNSRTFHDGLNDPSKRLDYYKSILWNRRMEINREKHTIRYHG